MKTNESSPQDQAPTAPEAERALIGAIVYTHGQVLDHLEFDPSDYHEPRWELLHTIASHLRQSGRPVDPITLSEEMGRHNHGKDISADLHRLAELPSSPAAAEHYARIIQAAASRRRILEMTAKARSRIAEGADPDTVIAEAHDMLEGIRNKAVTAEPVRFIGETIMDTIEAMAEPPKFHPTPWRALNEKIGGYRPGALYVVGARTGVGKSLWALESALSLAQHGSVAFISPEMPEREVHQRALANQGRVTVSDLINHDVKESDVDRLGAAAERLQKMPIAVREGDASLAKIRRFLAAVNRRKPLAGIVVDYLQMIRPPEGDRRSVREQVAEASWAMKDLAMKYQVPVIALAQLSRSAVTEDKPPMVHHLKESGSVEQDADVVLLLHRPPAVDYEIQVIIGKNRHGPTGDIALDFAGYYSSIGSRSQKELAA